MPPPHPYRTTKCGHVSIFQQGFEPVAIVLEYSNNELPTVVSCSVLSTKGCTLKILPAATCVHHTSLPLNIVLHAFKLKAVVTNQQTFENFSYSKWQFRGSVPISDCILCGLCSCIWDVCWVDCKGGQAHFFINLQLLPERDAVTSYWFNWFNGSRGFLPFLPAWLFYLDCLIFFRSRHSDETTSWWSHLVYHQSWTVTW